VAGKVKSRKGVCTTFSEERRVCGCLSGTLAGVLSGRRIVAMRVLRGTPTPGIATIGAYDGAYFIACGDECT